MVYLHQRLAQDTQGKASATSQPGDEAENSHEHVSETLPVTLHATIYWHWLSIFFSLYSSKSKGENELRQFLEHCRNPACRLSKLLWLSFSLKMVDLRGRDGKERWRRRAQRGCGILTGVRHRQPGKAPTGPQAGPQIFRPDLEISEEPRSRSTLTWTIAEKRGFCFRGRHHRYSHPIPTCKRILICLQRPC